MEKIDSGDRGGELESTGSDNEARVQEGRAAEMRWNEADSLAAI